MKKTAPTKSRKRLSWLKALHQAAAKQQVPLPPFTDRGMGSAICRSASRGRFASVKRRLVPATDAAANGVEWILWSEEEEQLCPVAVFREPLHPTQKDVSFILSALKGWLINDWSAETAKQHARDLAATGASKKSIRKPPTSTKGRSPRPRING